MAEPISSAKRRLLGIQLLAFFSEALPIRLQIAEHYERIAKLFEQQVRDKK